MNTKIATLHAKAITAAQEKNYSAAIEYLQQAIQLSPDDPVLQLHLANSLKGQGLFNQAATILKNTIAAHSDFAPAYNNLGSVLYHLGKLEEAIPYFNLAIEKEPGYVDAYYNLGLALAKKNKTTEAIAAYQTLLKLKSEHFPANFHLACAYMRVDNYDEAIKKFLYIEENFPPHYETQLNLATSLLKKGELNLAKEHYLKALTFSPEDSQILFNLGYINTQQGHTDTAIQYYQRLLHIDANYFPAHNNIAIAFLAKQHANFALYHFQQALRIQPNNKALQHTINILSQNQHLLTSPPDYITSLFDAYADHYDLHLLKALDYHVPEILYAAVKKLPKQALTILDIGCGTGLSGIVFKPHAKKLIGVDLSSKMLAAAKQKDIYDELINEDFLTYLAKHKNEFDLMIAGDVIVYIGDLTDTFSQASAALRQQGLFVFNTEINDQADFSMNQSGRFSHRKDYIERLAQQYQFKIIHYQIAITRQQNNEPVYGHVFVLQNMVDF